MEQKKIDTQYGRQLEGLIEKLQGFIRAEQYHRIFETVLFCIKLIEEGEVGGKNLSMSARRTLLESCELLDNIAEEFFYRKRLGEILLRPLSKALNDQTIIQLLPFEDNVGIRHKRLCDHKAVYHEDFINYNESNPHRQLLEIHVDCLHYAQSDLDKFADVAIIMRILDFWRTLSYNEYRSRDIQPLLELGNDLLRRIKECAFPLRKKALWRMALLLQMLLRDHPSVKELIAPSRLLTEFELSLIPVDDSLESRSFTPATSDNFARALFTDYKSKLRRSRVLFEVVKQNKVDVFKAQHHHSHQVVAMLEEMVAEARNLLGLAPCEIVVCILGSTSRHDRRPYSDLEYMILHDEVPVEKKKEVEVYICHLISIFELMIVGLGETAQKDSYDKGGLRIDTSVLETKSWGTPEAVAKKYVTELSLLDTSSPRHPWLDHRLFEFLHAAPLEYSDIGSEILFLIYTRDLELYLSQAISEADAAHIITRRFKINKEDWWKGLTRKQGVALASLCEVIHSNEKAYLNLKVGTKVNLKALYYKPLVYCALSLNLYEDWEKLVPSKIIQQYCDFLPWGGEALLGWWQAALEYVLKEQVKQHLSSHCQDDSMVVKEDACWAGLDLIVEGFILPLQKGVRECLSGSLPISMLGYVLLKSYLNVRRVWLEKWEGKGLKRRKLLNHPLMQVLSSYPDESGWSPQVELILKRHHKDLLKLSGPTKTSCQLDGVSSAHSQSIRYLKEDILSRCFKEGKFVGDPEFSSDRCQVKKVSMGDRVWYVKVKDGNLEGLVAREYMAMMLHLLLGGEPHVALGWPIKLTLQSNGKANPYYAWISENAAGSSLAEIMQTSPDTWKSLRFDRKAFSQLFLFTFLTCPEDGQPENFKVIERDGEIKFIAIDYGQCFVAGDRKEKRFLGDDVSVLTLKTMIYFFDDMHKPLSEDLITRIRILDVDAWYSSWKSSMIEINALFKPILEEDFGIGSHSQRNKYRELIDLPEDVMWCIKSRLALLQQWLRKAQGPISGQSILESLDPLVASQYASLKPKIQTPEDFYQKIDVKAYVKAPQSGKMISRTTMTSLQQQTLTPKQLAGSCNFDPELLSRVDMGLLTAAQQEYHLQVLESLPPSKVGAFIRLNLSGCAIQENRLIMLLEKMPQLKELNLWGCVGINVMTAAKVLAHRPNATIFTFNYEVLCPKLRVLKTTIEHKKSTLVLDMSFEERQQLSQKILAILYRIDQLNKVLLKRLRDSDPFVRRSTVDVLARLGNAENWMSKALVKMLDDTDKYVRQSVAVALVRLKIVDDPVIRVLLKTLMSRDCKERKTAVEALGRSERADEDVIVALRDALGNSSDKWVSNSRLLKTLAVSSRRFSEFSDERFLEECARERAEVASLESEVAPVRASAAEALGRLGKADDRVIKSLMAELSNPHECVRVSAACALIRLSNAEEHSLNVLLQALNRSEVNFLRSASVIEAFGNLGIAEDSIIQPLLRLLQDSDWPFLRSAAADALGNLGRAEDHIIEALLSRLHDVDLSVRKSVAKALRHLGRVTAVDKMKAGLAGERGGFLKILRNASGSARERVYAAEALGLLEKVDDDVIVALLKGLKDSFLEVRKCSAETLGYLAILEDRVIEGLVRALSDTEEVCIAAAEALSIILNSKNLWIGIQKNIQQLAAKDLMPGGYVDEEQALEVAPESRLSQVVMNQNYAVGIRFFGRPSIAQINTRDVEFSELNQVALASQRAINVCVFNGIKRLCRVIPAGPDGDCGFTGARRVLDLLGRGDIASQISRVEFIVLIRNEFKKKHSPCKPIILQIFKADRIVSADENNALEEWCAVFIRKSYWMQEAHFKFLSMVFNIEFCFYCVDKDKNILVPELGNKLIYAGFSRETRLTLSLLHMTVALREENAPLNHFDGMIINPSLEQVQRIDLLLGEEFYQSSYGAQPK